MKKSKRILAVTLALTMCLPATGCGKKESSTKELSRYELSVETTIDHTVYMPIINDTKMYSGYTDYDNEGNITDCGVYVYDFEAKESNEIPVSTESDGTVSDVSVCNASDDGLQVEITVDDLNTDDSYVSHKEVISYDSDFNVTNTDVKDQTTVNYAEEEATGYSESEYDYCTVYSKGIKYTCGYQDESSKYFIRKYNEDGTEVESEIIIEGYLTKIFALSDGSIAVYGYIDDKDGIYKVDFDKKEIGDCLVDLGKYDLYDGFLGKNDTILLYSESYLYSADLNTGKISKILSFIDSDVESENIQGIYNYDNGDYALVINNYEEDDSSSEIDRLSKTSSNSTSKTEITLGVLSLDYELKTMVIKYNKEDHPVRIKIKEYADEETDDYEEALENFNKDVASGNCPDLIDFGSSSGCIDEYGSKGLLEDLQPYFEKDEDMSIDDMVESVVNAYKTGDKLYALPNTYSIQALAGATDVVGSDHSWTVEEFKKLADSIGKDGILFNGATREVLVYMLVYYNIDKYIDWTTGKCTFDDGDFEQILEMSSNYATEEESYTDYSDEEYVDTEFDDVRSGKQLLRMSYMYGIDEYMTDKAYFNKAITYKGMPSSTGVGLSVTGGSTLVAISAKSKHKDEAWEFLRQLYLPQFTDEGYGSYQMLNGFPIRKDDLDNYFENCKKVYTETDENGNEVPITNSIYVDDNEIDLGIPTDEDVAAVRDIIDSADCVIQMDLEIYNIISDEIEAFYSGEKSAKDVADVVQSRVSVYVKENS